MDFLHNLEVQLAGVYKGAPKLSDNGKKAIVGAWPWVALIFGIIQLLAAWGLWHLVHVTNTFDRLANDLSARYGYNTPHYGMSPVSKTMVYVGILLLLVNALILLAAYPKLKARQKGGWDLLFLGTLLNVVYGVLQIFMEGRGFGSLIFSVLESAVVLYFLFQIRDMYSVGRGAKPVAHTTTSTPSGKSKH